MYFFNSSIVSKISTHSIVVVAFCVLCWFVTASHWKLLNVHLNLSLCSSLHLTMFAAQRRGFCFINVMTHQVRCSSTIAMHKYKRKICVAEPVCTQKFKYINALKLILSTKTFQSRRPVFKLLIQVLVLQ